MIYIYKRIEDILLNMKLVGVVLALTLVIATTLQNDIGIPILTIEKKIRVFNAIIDILGMEMHQGFLSCKKIDGTFTCITVHDITATTINLYNFHRRFDGVARITTMSDFNDFLAENRIHANIDKLLFLECLAVIARKLAVENYETFLNNIIETSPVLESVNNILVNVNDAVTVVSSNYVLKVWYPFQNNVNGFSLYRNASSGITLKEILTNQSLSSAKITESLISVYVPVEFLNNITYQSSPEVRRNTRVAIIFIFLNNELRRVFQTPDTLDYLIGIALPGFCKRNYLPLLNVFFPPFVNHSKAWTQFGEDYFDMLDYPGYQCILNRMSYFSRNGRYEFESRRKNYCLVTALDPRSFKNISWLSPINEPIFLPYFCIKSYFKIFNSYCSSESSGNYYINYSDSCSGGYSTSKEISLLYDGYVRCEYDKQECPNSFSFHNESFTSILLKANILHLKGSPYTEFIQLTKSLISTIKVADRQLTYLSVILDSLNYSGRYVKFKSQRSYYYSVLNPEVSDGFICRSRELTPISKKNFSSIGYPPAADIDVMVILQRSLSFNSNIKFFIIDSGTLSEYTCRSMVVAVKITCDWCQSVHFLVFLRVTSGKRRGWGYWFGFNPDKDMLTLLCISGNNTCDSEAQLLIFPRPSPATNGNNTDHGVRFLNNLWSNSIHEFKFQHFELFQSLSHLFNVASVLGILNIMSLTLYNNWYRQKFYTIHITIALLYQYVSFLLSPLFSQSLVRHVFYYGYLSQITWILMYTYTNYITFVKVTCSMNKSVAVVIGWFLPVLVILLYKVANAECRECGLCFDGESIFLEFVVLPFLIICLGNLIILVVIKIKISRRKFIANNNSKRANIRAILIIPVFCILWLPVALMFASGRHLMWIRYVFEYIVIPLQGFVLFVIVVSFELLRKVNGRTNVDRPERDSIV